METWLDTLPADKVEEGLNKARAMNFTSAGRNFLEYAHGDERFALWLMLADRKCGRVVGLGIFDLADYTWADAYESGDSPSSAVRDALSNDDTFGGML